MTDLLVRGTRTYNEAMVELAQKMQFDRDYRDRVRMQLVADNMAVHENGVLYADAWNHIYGAMSESIPAAGGLLVTPDFEGAVRMPLRP